MMGVIISPNLKRGFPGLEEAEVGRDIEVIRISSVQ